MLQENDMLEDVVDWQTALERLGSEKLLNKVVSLFLKNVPGFMDDIGQAVESEDGEMIERSAHVLASSIAYLSADEVTKAVKRLELVGGERDVEQYLGAYQEVETQIERLKAALSTREEQEVVKRES